VTTQPSDTFVFFGASGDLAYKQIFPALQAITRRGHFDMPVIGVAKSGWNLDQLKKRARDSIAKNGDWDESAFAKLSARLRYIGDANPPLEYGPKTWGPSEADRPCRIGPGSSEGRREVLR
jgi:glucose-6-phosphate 1-dehydrogenase